MTLAEKREELKKLDEYSYSPDSFPGSQDWIEHRQAEQALKDFDAAHPEIVAEIIAQQKPRRTYTTDQLLGM